MLTYKNTLRRLLSERFFLISFPVLLFGTALFTYIFQYESGAAGYAYTVYALSCLFIPLLPLYTLSATARKNERQFEKALSVSLFGRTLGGYFALLTYLLIPTALLALTPVLFGSDNTFVPTVFYLGILGFFLLSANLISICYFVGHLFKKSVFSYLVSFGVLLALFLFNLLSSVLPVFIAQWIGLFNPFRQVTGLTSGRTDLTAVTFFLFSTAFFLAITCLVEKEKGIYSPKKKTFVTFLAGKRWIASLVLFALLIGGCIGLSFGFPHYVRAKIQTGNDFSDLSDGFVTELHNLDSDVVLLCLRENGERSDDTITDFLHAVANETDHIQLKIVEMSDIEDAEDYYSENTLVIQGENGEMRIIDGSDLYYYYNAYINARMTETEYYQAIYAYYQSDSDSEYYTLGEYLYSYSDYTYYVFDGEVQIANALRYATAETVKTIGFYNADDLSNWFAKDLVQNGYNTILYEDFTDLSEEDCDLLTLWNMTEDISKSDADALSSYLSNGGKVFLNTSYTLTTHPNLSSVLAEYGLAFRDSTNMICEGDSDSYYTATSTDSSGSSTETPYPYLIYAHKASLDITGDYSGTYFAKYVHAIERTDEVPTGVTVSDWLFTSDRAYLYGNQTTTGKYVFGAKSEKENAGTIVWLTGSYAETANPSAPSGLYDSDAMLLLTCFNALTGNEVSETENVAFRLVKNSYLSVSTAEKTRYLIFAVIALPILSVSLGIAYTESRKKRKP